MKPEKDKITPEEMDRLRKDRLKNMVPEIDMPARILGFGAGRAFANKSVRFQFIYSLVGLVLGLSSMVIGGFLCWSGVTGHSSLSAKLFGAATELSDAAPGTVLFVVGLLIVVATRFKVRLHDRG